MKGSNVMERQDLIDIIGDMIPQYCPYNGDLDWGMKIELELDGIREPFWTYKNSGGMGKLTTDIKDRSHEYLALDLDSKILERNYVEKQISAKWLSMKGSISKEEWFKIYDFLEELQERTYENTPVGINLIIVQNEHGVVPLNKIPEKKIIDVLAESNYTYFKIDKNLNLINYLCINWNNTKDKEAYSSIPNFLQPYASVMNSGEFGITLTRTKDILIYNKDGLLATKRKGHWTVYDNSKVKNIFREIVGEGCISGISYDISCNLFDLCWDLSYRRHGALIIVTSEEDLKDYIVNEESILSSPKCCGIRKILNDRFKRISISNRGDINDRAIINELASVDGAIIFSDNDGLLKAFGSIIKTAPNVKDVGGARSTAAESAVQYKSFKPIKISSDGDITLYKKVFDKSKGVEDVLRFKFY